MNVTSSVLLPSCGFVFVGCMNSITFGLMWIKFSQCTSLAFVSLQLVRLGQELRCNYLCKRKREKSFEITLIVKERKKCNKNNVFEV